MSEMVFIPVDRLVPHPDNPRKDLGDLTELAASIKENGVFQNLTVVPEVEDRFTVIIGHRRLAAAKLAGLTELPCVVVEMTPREQVQTMLLENMQRSDLTVFEQAQGFQMMLDLGATVEEIAEKSGFSEKTVRRRVKMMELDQKTLKEVSGRQLSLGDFDTLAQIEDIKARNKALESIGTSNFEYQVNKALRDQAIKKNRPLVKAWLTDVKAEGLAREETWSNKYEGLGGYIYLAKWGEDGNTPPKKLPDPLFFYLDDDTLRLYKKREKAKPEKKPPEQVAKEKAISAAWKALDVSGSMAHDLRKAFVEKLTATSKNRADVLYGALLGHLLESVDYNSPDRDAIYPFFGIEHGCYDPNRGKKLVDGLGLITDKALPGLIYMGFGDDGKDLCTEYNYKSNFPRYKRSPKMVLIYEWLQRLGYEISTEELSMLNGTHEAYRSEEVFNAAKEAPKA